MNDAPSRDELERIEDFLADRALVGLSDAEQRELDALLERYPGIEATEFDCVVADLDRFLDETTPAELPPELHARLLNDARDQLPVSRRKSGRGQWPGRSWVGLTGWFVAAACLLAMATIWFQQARYQGARPTLAEQRLALLESAENPLVLEWQAGPTAPAGLNPTGNVVWSGSKQRGFMTFRGLPVNDPREEQYQLWIIDAERDERYPVDGGVFNIPPETGEVIVPVRAKLRVFEPAMFAVTVEQPGGVVVSDRSRLPLLAKVEAD